MQMTLNFVQIAFMTLKHATIICLVVYCVCCYWEEALQPCIPNSQKSCNSCNGGCRLECTDSLLTELLVFLMED